MVVDGWIVVWKGVYQAESRCVPTQYGFRVRRDAHGSRLGAPIHKCRRNSSSRRMVWSRY